MKVGDLVRHRRNHNWTGLIVNQLTADGYFDVLKPDGIIVFVHEQSIEVISEHRCG